MLFPGSLVYLFPGFLLYISTTTLCVPGCFPGAITVARCPPSLCELKSSVMTSHVGAYWLSGWRLIFGALSISRLFMASPMTSPYFYLDHISNSCYFFPVFLASIFLYCLFIHILCFLQFLLSHKYVKSQKLFTLTL